jgi:predicted MFS family arabinose efflux permease
LWLAVPTPAAATHLAAPQDRRWSRVLTRELMPFYVGVFVLHFVLVGTFVGVPHVLRDVLGIAAPEHWKTYLGVFVASMAGTVPLILQAERSRNPDRILRAGIAVMAAAELLLVFDHRHYNAVVVPLTLFFATFNFLEARLPARLSQAAPHDARGLALGVFATFQFLGAFVGGAVSGALFGSPLGLSGVFLGSTLVVAAWWVVQRPARPRAAGA